MNAPVQISKRLVLVNSVSFLAARLFDISVLLWLQQYLLKRIDVEEYSLYPVLLGVIAFTPLLTHVLTGGLGRYVIEAYAKGDERRVTQVISSIFPLLCAMALAILVGGGVLSWQIARVLTIAPEFLWDAQIMMALMAFGIAVRLILGPFGAGLYAQQRFVLMNLIRVSAVLLRITLLFILLFGVSTRVLWVVVASVSANICELLVTFVISRRLLPALRVRIAEICWQTGRSVLSFGLWDSLIHLALAIRRGGGALLLNKLGTPVDVTCLHLGTLPYSHIHQVLYLMATPLQTPLTAMHALGSTERLRSTYLRGARYGLWAVLLISVPLIIYSRELVVLYVGTQYIVAATVMVLSLLTLPLAYANSMLPFLSRATAQIRPLALRRISMELVIVLLALYFVHDLKLGAVGYILAVFCVQAVGLPLLDWPLGWRLADVRFPKWLREVVWPGILPALIATPVWMGLQLYAPPKTWLMLAVYAAFGGICFILALLAFGLRPNDRKDLARSLTGVKDLVRAYRTP